jgi:hypothetical protein
LAAAPDDLRREAEGFAQRRRHAVDETLRLAFVLLGEQRAGHVEQQPAGRKAAPQRIEDRLLQRGHRRDVLGPPQPLAVGMAAHDA